MFRKFVVIATVVAAGLTISGCSGDATAGNSSSFGEITGSAVPVAEEVTALCAQIVTQALPLDAATALAESSGYASRVSSIDGEPQAVTMDFRQDRMNFEVESEIVVFCTTG